MNFHLPGLRSIHWKVFISHLLILILPCTYLVWTARDVVERAWLHSTEEGLIDIASIVAGVYSKAVETGTDNQFLIRFALGTVIDGLRESGSYKDVAFGKDRPFDLELILCDKNGSIIYDTLGRTGRLDSRDVRQALAGSYGSRWEKSDGSVKLYSTVPVRVQNEIIGTVSAVKPTRRIVIFIRSTVVRFALPATLALSLAALLAYLISGYITGIVKQLAGQAEAIAAGETKVKLETWSRSELGTLARALEKMRARLEGKAYVEDMVTNLSHELKTPLAAIRGAAEILEDSPKAEVQQRFLARIQMEVARLDRIVGNVLALSRVESQRPSPTSLDLTQSLALLIVSYQSRTEAAGLHFFSYVPNHAVELAIAAEQWELLCNNLVDNAIRFSRAGDLVEIKLEKQERKIVFTVKDTGVGIEADLLPKIFDRFLTTPSTATGERGTGLGLAIVRSIAETHGGQISVESQAGNGTLFKVEFPI